MNNDNTSVEICMAGLNYRAGHGTDFFESLLKFCARFVQIANEIFEIVSRSATSARAGSIVFVGLPVLMTFCSDGLIFFICHAFGVKRKDKEEARVRGLYYI